MAGVPKEIAQRALESAGKFFFNHCSHFKAAVLPVKCHIVKGTDCKEEKVVLPRFILDRIRMHEALDKINAYNIANK